VDRPGFFRRLQERMCYLLVPVFKGLVTFLVYGCITLLLVIMLPCSLTLTPPVLLFVRILVFTLGPARYSRIIFPSPFPHPYHISKSYLVCKVTPSGSRDQDWTYLRNHCSSYDTKQLFLFQLLLFLHLSD
jgi:hypothetical protein